ncbi:MAG TPA: hypothetical protein VNO21_07160 [Polyangiaceae bacterium]|nr:hypothetical protein [Polyangiaceae bacterium]
MNIGIDAADEATRITTSNEVAAGEQNGAKKAPSPAGTTAVPLTVKSGVKAGGDRTWGPTPDIQ